MGSVLSRSVILFFSFETRQDLGKGELVKRRWCSSGIDGLGLRPMF